MLDHHSRYRYSAKPVVKANCEVQAELATDSLMKSLDNFSAKLDGARHMRNDLTHRSK